MLKCVYKQMSKRKREEIVQVNEIEPPAADSVLPADPLLPNNVNSKDNQDIRKDSYVTKDNVMKEYQKLKAADVYDYRIDQAQKILLSRLKEVQEFKQRGSVEPLEPKLQKRVQTRMNAYEQKRDVERDQFFQYAVKQLASGFLNGTKIDLTELSGKKQIAALLKFIQAKYMTDAFESVPTMMSLSDDGSQLCKADEHFNVKAQATGQQVCQARPFIFVTQSKKIDDKMFVSSDNSRLPCTSFAAWSRIVLELVTDESAQYQYVLLAGYYCHTIWRLRNTGKLPLKTNKLSPDRVGSLLNHYSLLLWLELFKNLDINREFEQAQFQIAMQQCILNSPPRKPRKPKDVHDDKDDKDIKSHDANDEMPGYKKAKLTK